MNKPRAMVAATRTNFSSADIPVDAVASVLSCRETARLLRHMLARMPWAHLPYGEKQRLLRTIKSLSSDLSLALLILERNQTPKSPNPFPAPL